MRPAPAQRPARRVGETVFPPNGAPRAGEDADEILPWTPDDWTYGEPPARPVRRLPSGTRHPLPGLLGLLAFALLGAFCGWVSAQPTWLALGHGHTATATVTRCTGAGIGSTCTVDITGTGVRAAGLRLVGADAHAGQRVPVRVVNDSARVAYAGAGTGLRLRALLGLLLVLACGAGAVWASGAARLPRPGRLLTVPASFAVPLFLAFGLLVAAY
jgi:hypothetical protein